ncbi:MAG: hypothetical protein A2Y95_12615 [Deltaproteobacteria bacterium RBG_13_65_10]|nr:MAG: hypothetical protein A2Y95_12615 [Deltaproteobacteria bacterium RBG_13_65_10]
MNAGDPLLLDAKHLRKVYHAGSGAEVMALRDATFTLRRGEFACLLGPSGSGKSTLLHLLAGLLTPTSGSLRVAGLDVGRATPTQRAALRRRHVGFVFPSDNLSPVLLLRENVQLTLALRGAPTGTALEANRLLSRFGLAALGDRFPSTLSTGEAQRGAIVRAVAGGPSLLLADEPTAHLDAQGAKQLLDLFAEIREQGEVSVLVATHDERLARPAGRVLRMEDGRLLEEGAP